MKNLKRLFVLLVLGLSMFCPVILHAAGEIKPTGPETRVKIDGRDQRVVLTLTCIADASTGSFGTFSLDPSAYSIKGWYLFDIYIKPGTTGPTNGAWDLIITDGGGWIVSQDQANDLSSTAIHRLKGSLLGFPTILNNWTFSITGNSVNSATATIILIFTSN